MYVVHRVKYHLF